MVDDSGGMSRFYGEIAKAKLADLDRELHAPHNKGPRPKRRRGRLKRILGRIVGRT
jgi:hypothetical protein